jgi:hypothetical protein
MLVSSPSKHRRCSSEHEQQQQQPHQQQPRTQEGAPPPSSLQPPPLPDEVLARCLGYTNSPIDLARAGAACRAWRAVARG